MIADLLAREGGTRGTTGSAAAVPPKKRRRRRHKSRPVIVRKVRRRAAAKVADVVAPEPAPVAAKVEPAKGLRGQGKFADQLAELELVRVGLAAAGDDAKIIHTLQVRGDAALREMAGKAKLPGWLSKSMRMQWRRAAGRPDAKPRKRKPCPPAVPIPPVLKQTGPWTEEPNGVRSRQVVST